MRQFQKSRKAISPVFSTVLLILLVVAGMTVVFAFLVSYVEDFQTGQGSAVLENFVIENVWFKDANHIEITLYNYGKIGINITNIYIDGLSATFSFKNHDSIEIPAGEHRTAIANSVSITSSTPYQFKITTFRGSSIESHYVSPSEVST